MDWLLQMMNSFFSFHFNYFFFLFSFFFSIQIFGAIEEEQALGFPVAGSTTAANVRRYHL